MSREEYSELSKTAAKSATIEVRELSLIPHLPEHVLPCLPNVAQLYHGNTPSEADTKLLFPEATPVELMVLKEQVKAFQRVTVAKFSAKFSHQVITMAKMENLQPSGNDPTTVEMLVRFMQHEADYRTFQVLYDIVINRLKNPASQMTVLKEVKEEMSVKWLGPNPGKGFFDKKMEESVAAIVKKFRGDSTKLGMRANKRKEEMVDEAFERNGVRVDDFDWNKVTCRDLLRENHNKIHSTNGRRGPWEAKPMPIPVVSLNLLVWLPLHLPFVSHIFFLLWAAARNSPWSMFGTLPRRRPSERDSRRPRRATAFLFVLAHLSGLLLCILLQPERALRQQDQFSTHRAMCLRLPLLMCIHTQGLLLPHFPQCPLRPCILRSTRLSLLSVK
jgi:hypothetical protein